MVNCSFCGAVIPKGRGILYAKKDGTILYFCSSKCRKNRLKLGREGRRKKWTKAFRVAKGIEKKVEEEKPEEKKKK